jgi:hypothetical protein
MPALFLSAQLSRSNQTSQMCNLWPHYHHSLIVLTCHSICLTGFWTILKSVVPVLTFTLGTQGEQGYSCTDAWPWYQIGGGVNTKPWQLYSWETAPGTMHRKFFLTASNKNCIVVYKYLAANFPSLQNTLMSTHCSHLLWQVMVTYFHSTTNAAT